MGLLDVLRAGVAVAHGVTKPLQATVGYEQCTGRDEYGERTYAASVALTAIVEWKQAKVETDGGTMAAYRATVLFLDAPRLASATAGAGVGYEDRITLPDGSTGPIVSLGGFVDAGTNAPLATEVYVG